MRANWKIIGALIAGVGVGVVISCQRYDFEPVTPLAISQKTDSRRITARNPKANVMFVFDRSGSLTLPIDSTVQACRVDGGSGTCGNQVDSSGNPIDDCPPACVTRDRAIKSAIGSFLTDAGTVARFGSINFPSPSSECGPGSVQVDIPTGSDDATLNTAASRIRDNLLASSPSGGTPTAATLALLANYPRLQDLSSSRAYILVTDGVPNCNPNNPNDACLNYADQSACKCTLSGPTTYACCPYACSPNPPGNCPPGVQPVGHTNPYRTLGCLDKDGTVNTMSRLLDGGVSPDGGSRAGILGFVVGVGDETLGNGVTLNAMAEAGGRPRTCPNRTDAECGANNPCVRDAGICTREYYQAGSAQDLAQALEAIRTLIDDPCSFGLLETPSDPRLLSVIVNGQPVAAGPNTWRYTNPPPTVTFAASGDICNQLKNSSPQNPVDVEFRIVQTL